MKKVLYVIILGLIFSSATFASELTYTDLIKLIDSHHITSIEELLPQLPGDFRSGYTLMHHSRSLQDASFEQPRVILFGKDASLTCTFNGGLDQQGSDTVECFQFSRENRNFDFRQIQFPTTQNNLTKVQFSESNLAVNKTVSCTSCHGIDPRPNWDGYSTWHGAYGENDDQDDGTGHIQTFLEKAPRHPRYKFLSAQKSASTTSFLKGLYDDYSSRPNLRLSDFIGRMNAYRTARIVETKLTHWQALGFAISALQCEMADDQIQNLKMKGLNYPVDIALEKLFLALDIEPNSWSTQIFKDLDKGDYYEHQSGFGYLTIDTAMAIISKMADEGDITFKSGLKQLLAYAITREDADPNHFYTRLFAVLPDPDYFGDQYRQNVGLFCPELVELFSKEYAASK